MKSLKESILSSTNTGKESIRNKIEEWCRKHNVFYGRFKLNDKLEVECVSKNCKLILNFKDYTELPKYIKFAENPKIDIVINNFDTKTQITSFRGFPKSICSFGIIGKYDNLPSIEIKNVEELNILCDIKNKMDINVEFKKQKNYHSQLGIFDRMFDLDKLKYIKTKNLECLNLKLSGLTHKLLDNLKNEAPKNPVKTFEKPITEKGLKIIDDYFCNAIDLNELKLIMCELRVEIVKNPKDGKFYLCTEDI